MDVLLLLAVFVFVLGLTMVVSKVILNYLDGPKQKTIVYSPCHKLNQVRLIQVKKDRLGKIELTISHGQNEKLVLTEDGDELISN